MVPSLFFLGSKQVNGCSRHCKGLLMERTVLILPGTASSPPPSAQARSQPSFSPQPPSSPGQLVQLLHCQCVQVQPLHLTEDCLNPLPSSTPSFHLQCFCCFSPPLKLATHQISIFWCWGGVSFKKIDIGNIKKDNRPRSL